MATKPDQLNIRVDLELKQAFIQKAKENETSATDLLVNFMKQYLGMEVKNPSFSIGADTSVIEAKLTKQLDQRIAEIEKRLDKRVEDAIARLNTLGELAA
ncbi:MAG TPA: hypothetical protein V6D12_13745 [Candidatus Obscuribacterales bacterium]